MPEDSAGGKVTNVPLPLSLPFNVSRAFLCSVERT